ncbi:MAG: ATP-binding protein [Saprospiraceae bacterium]
MKSSSSKRQYWASILAVLVVAGVCYPLSEAIGYRTVSLILLLTVSVLAMRMSIGPVLLAAVLSAFIWDFFFIPPHFTLTVGHPEDALMLLMYFVVALLNGILTHEIRNLEGIARRKEDKEATLQLYNTLFNSISHEFRTPVATIAAASENLLTDGHTWSADDRRRMTEEIQAAAERLNRLVDNLLNMSRLESGHIVLHWKWCDVGELLNSAINRLRDDLESRRVVVSLPENLPLVRLDFSVMEQVLFNLLHNAAMYTPDGTTVRIEADYVDEHLVMMISDNGPGFEDDDLEQVFEKFFRAKGSKAGGTGLGLSIVRGFVEAHRGFIQVGNKPDGGAIFTLKIPTGHLPKNVRPES